MRLLHFRYDYGRRRSARRKATSQRRGNCRRHESKHLSLLQLSKNHQCHPPRRRCAGRSGEIVAMSIELELLNGFSLPAEADPTALAYEEPVELVEFHFGVSRRQFVQVLGAGIVIAVAHPQLLAQEEGESRARPRGRGGFGGGAP